MRLSFESGRFLNGLTNCLTIAKTSKATNGFSINASVITLF